MESLDGTKSRLVSNCILQRHQENLSFLDSLLCNIPEAIVMLDGHKQIVYWNHLAEEITGWLAAETVGYSIEEVFYKMGVDYSFNGIEEQLKTKGLCNFELVSYHKNGKCIYLDVNIRKTDDNQGQKGKFMDIIASFRDITKYKETESNSDKKCKEYVDIIESFSEGLFINDFENREVYSSIAALEDEIRVQKDIFKTVIDNMPLSFMIFDTNGDLVIDNAELRTGKWGYGNFASLYKAFKTFEVWDINGNRFSMKDCPACTALRGEFIKDKIAIVNYNNKQIIIELSSFPIYDKDNVLISAGVFFKDITEAFMNQNVIKVQQEKLLQSKRDKIEVLKNSIKMKDEFLSFISHEFKTPITVILSAIQSMRYICKDELSEKANKYLNIIMQNSNRELKLVNNILDLTRINENYQKVNKRNMDIVSLTRSITESIKVYSEKKGIELSFSTTFTEKVMGIDEEKYERILLNLLSNAVKYTPNGKVIEVKLFKKVVDHRCMVFIQVKDSGIGIPEDKHKHIFARFGQVDSSLSRQAEGTGLGLSLVKLLVDLLGGEITLESIVGKGSSFTVALPARKVKESNMERFKEIKNFRLIQAIDIEFSDVYM